MKHLSKSGRPKLVEHATAKPGRCAVSGTSSRGPFIDTGLHLRGFGVIYIAVRALETAMRAAGWMPEQHVKAILADAEATAREAEALRADAQRWREVRDLLAQVMPKPDPIVNERVTRVPRDPTAAEIATFLERNPSFLEAHKPARPGSAREWEQLYNSPPGKSPRPFVEEHGAEPEPGDGRLMPHREDEVPREITIHDQVVDLDHVLDANLSDIGAWADGKDAAVLEALVARERWRAQVAEKEPRKGVLNLLASPTPQEMEPTTPPDRMPDIAPRLSPGQEASGPELSDGAEDIEGDEEGQEETSGETLTLDDLEQR